MSAQHTPGPWFVGDEDEDAGGWEYTDVHAGEYGEQSFCSVAHVQGRWDGDREMRLDDVTRANARLIAAAPELLSAAETVLAGLNARIDNAPPDAVPLFAGIADLHSAIAKATGGAA